MVPKLWTETIEAHRQAVREAVLDTTATLAAEHGLLSVTMSQIAEETGIGRATLYKYFPDVESILLAWHAREIGGHLDILAEVRHRPGDAVDRLKAVLEAYAHINRHRVQHHRHQRHGTELAAFLHRDEHVAGAQHQVHEIIRDLLIEGVRAGTVRRDVSADELAGYCLHALRAAESLPSQAAVRRLVAVTMAGLAST